MKRDRVRDAVVAQGRRFAKPKKTLRPRSVAREHDREEQRRFAREARKLATARRAVSTQKTLTFNRLDLKRSILRDSFEEFVREFWPEAVQAPMRWSWHMSAICTVLQEAAERVFRGEAKAWDVVLNVPPGSTKSTLCSIMFPAWVWTRMPTCRLICASYAHDLALDLATRCRDVILSDKWKLLFPEVELRFDQNAKGHFKNSFGGERFCASTGGRVTGLHANLIVIDDPLNPEQAMSDLDLKTSNRWVCETLSRRKVDAEVSVMLLIMQRLHQQDPSAEMIKRAAMEGGAKVRHINLPAEVEGSGLDVVRPRKLARLYSEDVKRPGWKLLDPVRISRKALEEARVELGPGYSGQMLQRPTPRGGAMFEVGKIKIARAPRYQEMRAVYRSWDKATSQGKTAAYTVGVKIGEDRKGQVWILDVVRGRWAMFEREDRIHQTAKLDGVSVEVVVEQEPGSGGLEQAQATVRRLRGFRCRVVRPTGDKELRAEPFAIQVGAGNVLLADSFGHANDWNATYLAELENFPRGYKDQVDATSQGFSILTKPRVRTGGLSAAFRDRRQFEPDPAPQPTRFGGSWARWDVDDG